MPRSGCPQAAERFLRAEHHLGVPGEDGVLQRFCASSDRSSNAAISP
jgi:hypothetical protein